MSLPPPPEEARARGRERIRKVFESLRSIRREPAAQDDFVYFLDDTGGEFPFYVAAENADGTLTLMSVENVRGVLYRVSQERICRVPDFEKEMARQEGGKEWQ